MNIGRGLQYGRFLLARLDALLGQGRCLLALGHAGAEVPLAEAPLLAPRIAST